MTRSNTSAAAGDEKVKLFSNDRERWGRFILFLIVGDKERNTKESIIKLIKGLAFVRLSKDPVVKVSDHQGLAGLEVGANVIEYARLRAGRGPSGAASGEQRSEQEGTDKVQVLTANLSSQPRVLPRLG